MSGAETAVRLDVRGLAALIRPRIAGLVLVTTACGFVLEQPHDYGALPWAMVGTLLVAAAGCALNHFLEQDVDARMERTRHRPLVTGALTPRQVVVGAFVSALLGLGALLVGAGLPAFGIETLALVVYLGVYTPLKRRTSLNTWVGALPGALPLLAGAAAAGGPGRLSWIAFLLVFLWQLPHFFAIASMYREDYASGGLCMLSGQDPDDELLRWQMPMQVMSVMLVSILPVLSGPARVLYLATALGVGLVFLAAAWGFRRMPDRRRARRVVLASVVYLPLVLLALVLDVACAGRPSGEANAAPCCAEHGPEGTEAQAAHPPVVGAGAAQTPAAGAGDAGAAQTPAVGPGDAGVFAADPHEGEPDAPEGAVVVTLDDFLSGDARPEPVEDGTGLVNHGEIPDFTLVAEDGRPFGREQLRDEVWVVDFIFTRCAGPCVPMAEAYVDLQTEDLPATFLSITVDPRYDGPEVLEAYRERWGGQADDWRLLTGGHEAIQALAETGFRLPVNAGTEPVAGMAPMFHSGKFALVDKAGRVRGYYDYRDRLELDLLRADVAKLAAVPVDSFEAVDQPTLHAVLNGTAAFLLVLGWMGIRGRGLFSEPDRAWHARFMLAAVAVSAAFLASYLDYHSRVGSRGFWGEGWIRTVYLLVLVPHIILAAVMVPMILLVLVHAFRGHLERHRKLARWTLPIWLYVSVTGVLVYLMLYRLGP